MFKRFQSIHNFNLWSAKLENLWQKSFFNHKGHKDSAQGFNGNLPEHCCVLRLTAELYYSFKLVVKPGYWFYFYRVIGPVVQWIEWQIPVLLVESSSLSGITGKQLKQLLFKFKGERRKEKVKKERRERRGGESSNRANEESELVSRKMRLPVRPIVLPIFLAFFFNFFFIIISNDK